MVIFKILLIILIALPVIALASYFYSQMLSYIKVKNAIEDEAIRQSAIESKTQKTGKKSKKETSVKDAAGRAVKNATSAAGRQILRDILGNATK